MNAAAALLAVLDRLLWVLLAYRRAAEQKRAQAENDSMEKNPARWFTLHFGGVREQLGNPAARADKAEPDGS